MTEDTGIKDNLERVEIKTKPDAERDLHPVKLLGYPERGMINALCEDIHYSEQPLKALVQFQR